MSSDKLYNPSVNTDLASTFSFEKSEYMTPSEYNEQKIPSHYEGSQAASEGCSSVYSGEKTSVVFNKEELLVPHTREISGYSASSLSEREHSIAEPVSITVVDSGNVKTAYSESNLQDEDSELDDDGIQPIRKLNTVRSTDFRRSPNYSYNTSTDAPIPPRSSKRPKSELLDTNNDLNKDLEKMFLDGAIKHSKHQSLSLNDGLDKLMLSARSISSKTDLFNCKNEDGTNEPQQTEELDNNTQDSEIRSNLQNSQQKDEYIKPEGSNYIETESIHTKNSYEDSEILISPLKSRGVPKSRVASTTSLPPRPSAESIQKARHTSNHVNTDHTDPITPQEKTTELEQPNPEVEKRDQVEPQGDAIHQRTDSYGIIEIPNTEISSTNQSPKDIRNQPKYDAQHQIEDDDEYYDIDEEHEVTNQPSRAKSVKDSTQNQRRTRQKKTKSKKNKISTRPFSYSTLISLLESTNGTIIGEEFSQLNLPVREKQLIEKIVDSLSRLSSEMVLDEQKYDVGIQRLEKALRALEGFL